eukprot:TRINITY_DN68207_c0_g1_i1.p1 TRINITY_DN68207_c0_g1~~TRINITY_DN68207_c0_g1_i1.p1  ORF type:complete len:127 (+),score=27.81 TRINITY_DN68207_c0_g1_i1:70-450(+)
MAASEVEHDAERADQMPLVTTKAIERVGCNGRWYGLKSFTLLLFVATSATWVATTRSKGSTSHMPNAGKLPFQQKLSSGELGVAQAVQDAFLLAKLNVMNESDYGSYVGDNFTSYAEAANFFEQAG